MPIRYHAQRKHIISSLESLLYQLYTLSFFLAPSVWAFLCRCAVQLQFARAQEFDDGKWSLRFWFVLVLLVNTGSVWTHASVGVPPGRGVVLDFVGMGRTPSKLQLLSLDFTIMFLQALLTTISYETSLTIAMPRDTADPLMPPILYTDIPLESYDRYKKDEDEEDSKAGLMDGGPKEVRDANPFHYPPRPTASNTETYATNTNENASSSSASHPSASSPDSATSSTTSLPPREPIVNLRLRHVVHRLTSPAPVPPPSEDTNGDNLGDLGLPLPNTTGAGLARTIRILAQANVRRQMRLRMAEQRARRMGGANADSDARASSTRTGPERSARGGDTSRPGNAAVSHDNADDADVRIPGGMYPPES